MVTLDQSVYKFITTEIIRWHAVLKRVAEQKYSLS
jgi:hypothetical protein